MKNKLRIVITATIACAMVFAMAALASCNNGNDDYWRQRLDEIQVKLDYLQQQNRNLINKVNDLEQENQRLERELLGLKPPLRNTDGVFEAIYMPNIMLRHTQGVGGPAGIDMLFAYNQVQGLAEGVNLGASGAYIGGHYSNSPYLDAQSNPPFHVVFYSNKVTTGDVVLRLSAEIEHFLLSNTSYYISLNGSRIDTPTETLIMHTPMRDIIFATNVPILYGRNEIIIRVLPNPFGPYGFAAPKFAHVRFENFNVAELLWRPHTHNLLEFNPARFIELMTTDPSLIYRNPWNS